MLKELFRSDAGEYNPSAHTLVSLRGIGANRLINSDMCERYGYVAVYNSRACYFGCETLTACLMTRRKGAFGDTAACLPVWGTGQSSKTSAPPAAFAIFASVDLTDRANRIDIVAAEFHRTLPQCGRAHEPEESLRSGQEIAALPQNQIKVLPRDRQKVQARRQRNGACGDTAVGAVRAHRLCDIHSGRANRRDQGEIIRRDVSARQQCEQQQLRASAGRSLR